MTLHRSRSPVISFIVVLSVSLLGATLSAQEGAAAASSSPTKPAKNGQPNSLQELYGDWAVVCNTSMVAGEETRNCRMILELSREEDRKRLLTLILTAPEPGAEVSVTVIAPFGISLADGLSISLEEKILVQSAFKTALPVGTIAEFELPESGLAGLVNGASAEISFVTQDTGQKFSMAVPLNGFAAALKRLRELTP